MDGVPAARLVPLFALLPSANDDVIEFPLLKALRSGLVGEAVVCMSE